MEEGNNKEVTNEELEAKEILSEEQKETPQNDAQEVKEEVQQEETVNEENQTSSAIVEVKKEKKKKKTRKKRYFTGTIGAILGAIIFVLPWIFRYIYARNDFAMTLLSMIGATLIPLGSYLGYKLFRGKVGKPYPVIITIFSIISILVATTVICPIYLMYESGFAITWPNYRDLFSNIQEEVRDSIIEDAVAGLVFTTIGLWIVIGFFIKKQLRDLTSEEERIRINEEARKQLKEKTDMVKVACKNLNCMSKESAISKKIIVKEIKNICGIKTRKSKQYFLISKLAKLLKRKKGKYYYDEENEEAKLENAIKINKKVKRHNFRKILKRILITILLVVIIAISALYIWFKVENFHYINDTDVMISIDESKQRLYGTPEQINEKFGEGATAYYDFIVEGKEENGYDIYGQIIKKTDLPDYRGVDELIQDDRDYYAMYYTEETTSEVSSKQLGYRQVRSYNYKYGVSDEEIYSTVIYLYETRDNYVFLNVFAVPIEDKIENVDIIIEDLLK